MDPELLLRELTTAQVLAAEQAAGVLAEVHAAGAGNTSVAAAEFLVQAGLLTPYQAERALAGFAAKLSVGPYLIHEPVGTGSLGTVYRALRHTDRHRYAVKVLPLRSMWNVVQARRQVQVFAELPPHPAVIPFVDVGTAGGNHYLAWPFIEGESFEHLIRRAGPLPPAHAARFLTEVADGLDVCHRHGIVHGLLKPSNLMLGPDRKAHILDLGIGAILTENVADDESMLDTISTANTAMGMLDCAAPETLAEPTTRTMAGDMYSFGCVLYYLLTGVYPFPHGTAVDKIIAHQSQEPEPVRRRNPDVPQPLADLVSHLMRKSPQDRPTGMAAVRDVLSAAIPAGEGEISLPAPAVEEWAAKATRGNIAAPTPWPSVVRLETTGDGAVDPNDSVNFDIPALQETSANLPPPAVLEAAPADANAKPEPRTASEKRTSSAPAPPIPLRAPTPLWPVVPRVVGFQQDGIAQSVDRAPADVEAVSRANPRVTVPPPPVLGTGAWARLVRAVCFWLPPWDVVQVSVFGPWQVAPGETARLQVYAHPPESFVNVRTLSRAFQPDTELLASGYADVEVPRSADLALHLGVRNAGVAKSLIRFKWAGQTRPWSFEVYVPWESPPGPSVAIVTIALNNVQVGQVRFELLVLPRAG